LYWPGPPMTNLIFFVTVALVSAIIIRCCAILVKILSRFRLRWSDTLIKIRTLEILRLQAGAFQSFGDDLCLWQSACLEHSFSRSCPLQPRSDVINEHLLLLHQQSLGPYTVPSYRMRTIRIGTKMIRNASCKA
jgi:hypothetical protein